MKTTTALQSHVHEHDMSSDTIYAKNQLFDAEHLKTVIKTTLTVLKKENITVDPAAFAELILIFYKKYQNQARQAYIVPQKEFELVATMMKQLLPAYTSNGTTVDEYYNNIQLPELTKSELATIIKIANLK